MAPGARSKFGAPMFEPEDFRKQMYCIEESTCDIVCTFGGLADIRRPHSDSAPVLVLVRCRVCKMGAPIFILRAFKIL